MARCNGWVAAVVSVVCVASSAAAAETLRIGGTGSATEMMRFAAGAFAGTGGPRIEVIPSLGSNGGLRALDAGMLDIAVSARKPNAAESSKGFTVRAAIRSPWGLATSHPRPNGLQSASMASLYGDGEARWADGTPIRILLRPKGDTANQKLAESFPGMAPVLEQLRRRGDIPIAATDQDNAGWGERIQGSLISIAFTQVKMERRNLRMVAIDGVEPTFENFEQGKYRLGKSHYIVTRAQVGAEALRFIAYLKSEAGQQTLRATASLLVTE